MEHIPNREFSRSIDMESRRSIIKKYSDPKWDKAKSYVSEKSPISNSAVKIADTMKKKLGIDLFPHVNKIACKGFNVAGGTYAFSMYDGDGKEWYFDQRSRYYQSSKREYFIYNDPIHRSDDVIIFN